MTDKYVGRIIKALGNKLYYTLICQIWFVKVKCFLVFDQ